MKWLIHLLDSVYYLPRIDSYENTIKLKLIIIKKVKYIKVKLKS